LTADRRRAVIARAAPFRRAGEGDAASLAAIQKGADDHAARLRLVVADLRAEGIATLAGIAAALNDQGITTPRGAAGKTLGRPRVNAAIEDRVRALRREGKGIHAIVRAVGCGAGTAQTVIAS